jgi:zinc protease
MAIGTRIAAIGLASLVGSGIAVAQDAVGEPPAIANFTLENGLEVVVIPDRRAPVVTHMLWYKVGSADEEPGRSGYAHFFEHLMFKGTETYPAGEFSRAIAEVGGRENAFTSYDYTAYFQQVAPSELDDMMRFEADRMYNLVLSDDVIGPERDVVIEERNSRVENSPGALLGETVNATLFQNHPYGVPIIGWMHEIEQFDRETALEFYREHYGPNNAVLVVSGDVDADEVRELAEEHYGPLPRNEAIVERARPVEPRHHGERTVTLRDDRVGVPSVGMYWLAPSYATAEPGEAEALDLLAEILGGGVRSRIYQKLIVEDGTAASVGAYYRGSALDRSTFVVYGSPRGDAGLEAIEASLKAEIARIRDDGVTAEELDAAKRRFIRSMMFARDDQSGMARIYGAALTTGMTVADVEEWPDRIEAVTAEAVQAAAQRYLSAGVPVTSYLLPQGDEPT